MNPERITNSLLGRLLGKVPIKIYRIWYKFGGELEPDDGPLEIEFEGGSTLFATSSDGARLAVVDEPWRDSFTEPLSEENERYVAEHGKWVKVDVSADEPYASLIGIVVDTVVPLKNTFGAVAGVEIGNSQHCLHFWVEGDEARATSLLPSGYTRLQADAASVS